MHHYSAHTKAVKEFRNRLIWILFFILTILILLTPVDFSLVYRPVQAPYIIKPIILFVFYYFIWILLLFYLFFNNAKDRSRTNYWQYLLLLMVFSLVFCGFWVFKTPYGGWADAIYNMAHVEYLNTEGYIPHGHSVLAYFDFPGLHILTCILSNIAALDVFDAAFIFLLFNIFISSLFLFLFFINILKNVWFSSFAVLLFIQSNILFADDIRVFYPRILGWTLLIFCLWLFSQIELLKSTDHLLKYRLILIIVFISMTITYLPSSLVLSGILLFTYLVKLILRKENNSHKFKYVNIIILFISITLAWEIFWTWRMFGSLVLFLPRLQEHVLTGEFIKGIVALGGANLGPKVPLWALCIRLFWWLFIFVTGLLMGISLFFSKKYDNIFRIIILGGLAGSFVIGLISAITIAQGVQIQRIIMYTPIFCIPLVIIAFRSIKIGRLSIMTILIVIFILLSPFTFLISPNTISTDAIYQTEMDAGKFLEAVSIHKGSDIVIYSAESTSIAWAYYFIPNAVYKMTRIEKSWDKDRLWIDIRNLLGDFTNNENLSLYTKIWVDTDKTITPLEHLFSISMSDENWIFITRKLDILPCIYNNGTIRLRIN